MTLTATRRTLSIIGWVAGACAMLDSCASSLPPQAPYSPPPLIVPSSPGAIVERAIVVKVLDADTIDLRLSDGRDMHVQLIGVDAPDSGAAWRGRANKFAAGLLPVGRQVFLEVGPKYYDHLQRHLAYVWLAMPSAAGIREAPARMLNAILLSKGFAKIEVNVENPKYASLFRSLQLAARRARRGIWS